MAKKPRRKIEDVNQAAHRIVREATGDTEQSPAPDKDPAAVLLGRRGGLKGGRARADRLSAERKTEIARAAAKARWSKKRRE